MWSSLSVTKFPINFSTSLCLTKFRTNNVLSLFSKYYNVFFSFLFSLHGNKKYDECLTGQFFSNLIDFVWYFINHLLFVVKLPLVPILYIAFLFFFSSEKWCFTLVSRAIACWTIAWWAIPKPAKLIFLCCFFTHFPIELKLIKCTHKLRLYLNHTCKYSLSIYQDTCNGLLKHPCCIACHPQSRQLP